MFRECNAYLQKKQYDRMWNRGLQNTGILVCLTKSSHLYLCSALYNTVCFEAALQENADSNDANKIQFCKAALKKTVVNILIIQ